MNKTHIAINQ